MVSRNGGVKHALGHIPYSTVATAILDRTLCNMPISHTSGRIVYRSARPFCSTCRKIIDGYTAENA
jgi:hypothetical protein